ncbi:hypothetical protein [Haloferax elongans]|uniref:hypothetical protein n=1 Tax=Haloferax elongans TaxID=403191 RepID=UPI0012671DE8|nr:hypothetical protein [Haloferax elongans]
MAVDSVFAVVEVSVDDVDVHSAVGTVGLEPPTGTLEFVWGGCLDTGDALLVWLFGRSVAFVSGEPDTDHDD